MQKRLYRIRHDRIFGGVSTGIAEYFDIDVVLVRVAFIVLGLMHGIGVILYIILWIVVPERHFAGDVYSQGEVNNHIYSEGEELPREEKHFYNDGRFITGIFLIIIGILFLADRFFPYIGFQEILSLGLIIIGLIILWNAFRR
jgi:phage shock protein C